MLETLPQQPAHYRFSPQTPQQPAYNCREYSRGFHCTPTPTSPSPLGLRHVNAQAAVSPMMCEFNKPTPATFSNQENWSSPLRQPCDSDNNNQAGNKFTFAPAFNTVTPPNNRRSTYEQRFRESGGSSNPYARIFGSPSHGSPRNSNGNDNGNETPTSASTSTSAASRRHRQLFLNRVKQNRDDARFSSRGESLMMMEYHSEQQSWDEQMRQRAAALSHQYRMEDGAILESDDIVDECDDLEVGHMQDNPEQMTMDPDQFALEEYIMQEENMDLTLVDDIPRSEDVLRKRSPVRSVRSGRSDESIFGGDDRDYDDIFMELAE